ncbi:MAG: FecR family protein [Xanthobacteraceae bacterium]|nr:FecR family protein [Xanthobacteraceae bacterium]
MNDSGRFAIEPFARAALVAASLLATTAAGSAQTAGRVGAVNQDATGTPPGATSRMLSIGTNVVHNEKVQTSAQGTTQIIFPDTSTLNIGRGSTVVINEYVYDPNAGSGSMVASVSKGVLRFVGGSISHTTGVTINTPVSVIGIRGGVATVVYPVGTAYAGTMPGGGSCKGELVIGHVGSSTIQNKTGSVTLKPGFATCVTGPNDPIPPPFRVPDSILQLVMKDLTSGPGQSGGAVDIPTDQMANRFGFGTGTLPDPTHPPGTDPLGYIAIFDAGNSAAQNQSQATQTTQGGPPPNECGECTFSNGSD